MALFNAPSPRKSLGANDVNSVNREAKERNENSAANMNATTNAINDLVTATPVSH